MKLFFQKMSYFFLAIFIYCIFNFCYNFYFENYPKKIDKNIAFIGDSHMRYSIIPDSFQSSVNYGLNADLLITQYWKIDELVRQSFDTIIISIGYHTFKEDNIVFFKRKDGVVDELLNRYILINGSDIFRYISFDSKFFNCVFNKIKRPIFNYEYQGSYVKINNIMTDKAKSAIWRHFSHAESFNQNSINTIERIINKCNNLHVKILFVFPPVSKYFENKIPTELKLKADNYLMTLKSKKLLIDFKMNTNDSMFFDGDHLNYFGAQKYTHFLKNILYKTEM